ncbi:MAG TPA: helix-turn-helix domain-containing protein [Pseudolabrys sp.]|nr:helix-turn-helix domain-containing protein [Pseudolabrys sp.]
MSRPRTTTATPSERLASARRRASGVRQRSAGKRKERSAARRDAILAAALEEFSARGFEATRLDDVARRASIAKGTIYLYFRDKESLFQELIHTMLTPIVGTIEALGAADLPVNLLADRLVDLFVREVYETRRKDVIRLMIAEGRRFPKLAEFYYREVLSRIIAAMRAVLRRAAARGEVPAGLVDFPQLIAAPGLVAIVWSGLFEKFEPLDVRAMMKTYVSLLFAGRAA